MNLNTLFKRSLTAVIGAPILIYIILIGKEIFACSILILALIAWHELVKMFNKRFIKVWQELGVISIAALSTSAYLGTSEHTLAIILFTILAAFIRTVLSSSSFSVVECCVTLASIFYIGITFSYLILLRCTLPSEFIATPLGEVSIGLFYFILPLLGTWTNDITAYLMGSAIGKHKLCPKISPGKSVEGAISGLIGSILVVTLIGMACGITLKHLIIIGTLTGLFAIIGDLVESALKRFCDVKDSGSILPGHGGILDRFDALIFVVPVVYYYIKFFMI
ncbi:phosphatidate cytidylyltransferase [Selenomonadales bacterium OttesenSCG-928-I06]|nr:phosphatidate cytidylyltransferase [Selenomonadales bacterium OttesenSCG-928-I06]